MARINVIKNNFTGGELSPELDARFDTPLYSSGVRTLENFITLREGAITRRPGTEHIDVAANHTKKIRLIPYERAATQTYILELSNLTMRVYTAGERVTVVNPADPVVTPWVEDDLFDLQFAQDSGDSNGNPRLWIVHPNYAPRRIDYTSDTHWAITQPSWTRPTSVPDFASGAGKYPRTITFYQQRLILGGTGEEPQTIWGSRSPDEDGPRYTDFTLSDADDSVNSDHAFEFTMASDRVNVASWLLSKTVLFLGTNGAEYAIADIDPDGTPSINRQSTYGSKPACALLINDSALFIQRGGEIVREMTFSQERGTFVAKDLTTLSRHILYGGVQCIDFQQEPQSVVWFVRKDGQMATLTYDREEGIIGWARQVTRSDSFESVAVIGSDDDEDEVWVSTIRSINGSTERHIERFKTRRHMTSTTREEVWYVDDGKQDDQGPDIAVDEITQADPGIVTTVTSHGFDTGQAVKFSGVVGMTEINTLVLKVGIPNNPNDFSLKKIDGDPYDTTGLTDYISGGVLTPVTLTVDGLGHLEGETVSLVTDGSTHPDRTVASGSITLQHYSNTTNVGLPFTSTVQPMKIEAGGQLGPAIGQPKRISRVILRVLNSVSGKVGTDSSDLEVIPSRDSSDPMDAPPPLASKDQNITFRGGWETEGNIVIVQDFPQPLTVLAIVLEMETNDIQ